LIRVHAVVEGQTEEAFINGVLAPELGACGAAFDARSVKTGRKRLRDFRGGTISYHKLKNDLTLWMKEDQNPDAWFTTMVDLYRLPPDFPGYEACRCEPDPVERANRLEACFAEDIAHRRFVPYIQVHEFEALLFSEPEAFEIAFPGRTGVVAVLESIRRTFPTPEHIDDGTETAPSKRILAACPGYDKRVSGPLIVQYIGMATLRRECVHFDCWIRKLEGCALTPP